MLPAASIFHRNAQYMECTVNGVKLALFDKPVNINDDLPICLPEHSVVILETIKAKSISIKANNIIALNILTVPKGDVTLNATRQFISVSGHTSMDLNVKADEFLYQGIPLMKSAVEKIKNAFADGISQQNVAKILEAVKLADGELNTALWGRAMAEGRPLPQDRHFFGVIRP